MMLSSIFLQHSEQIGGQAAIAVHSLINNYFKLPLLMTGFNTRIAMAVKEEDAAGGNSNLWDFKSAICC